MRESVVEARLGHLIRQMGGQSIKLMPTVAGVPDRLVLLPGGRHFLVELKTTTGAVRPAQYVWAQRAGEIGHPVVVLKGKEEVDRWVASLHLGNDTVD